MAPNDLPSREPSLGTRISDLIRKKGFWLAVLAVFVIWFISSDPDMAGGKLVGRRSTSFLLLWLGRNPTPTPFSW